MRALVFLVAAVGIVGHVVVRAQAQDTQAAGARGDLAGFYIGARQPFDEPEVYPFTSEGERGHSDYDPLTGDPRQYDDCAGESIPAVLWAGTVSNMQVIQEADDVIELHYEHGGAERTCHRWGAAPPAAEPHTNLGYSVGRWEGDALVIDTTNLNAGVVFTNRGYPLSTQTQITERYTRDAEMNLHMELTIEDLVNYTEPFKLGREWVWSPNDQLIPWNCVSLGDRDGEQDLDEIRRILNAL